MPQVPAIKPILWVNIFTLIFGGRLNGRCYFSVKKCSHREKKFQDVSSRLYADGRQVVIVDCQQHRHLNLCSHGVLIQVKQDDDDNSQKKAFFVVVIMQDYWKLAETRHIYINIHYLLCSKVYYHLKILQGKVIIRRSA